jgi:hypothetical protein
MILKLVASLNSHILYIRVLRRKVHCVLKLHMQLCTKKCTFYWNGIWGDVLKSTTCIEMLYGVTWESETILKWDMELRTRKFNSYTMAYAIVHHKALNMLLWQRVYLLKAKPVIKWQKMLCTEAQLVVKWHMELCARK